eukprot:1366004-Pleurochrysis_carterae.AAC.1
MLAASDACGLCAPLTSTPTHVACACRPSPGVRCAPHPRNAYTRACLRIMRHTATHSSGASGARNTRVPLASAHARMACAQSPMP